MADNAALNAICPYYTMFPLSFPLRVIGRYHSQNGWIADPFCGRGTTNLAARLSGTPTFGMDSSPVAVAIAEAKLSRTTVGQIVRCARRVLQDDTPPQDLPRGRFWRRMYYPSVLDDICRFRESFMRNCRSDTRKVLRALILGALHGPLTKTVVSHLSNQSPRTYAPKPAYALRFWDERQLWPPKVDVLEVVRVRAQRYLTQLPRCVSGQIRLGDSRDSKDYPDIKIGLAITSPPYYGMRTYMPDQWLRSWFLGGPSDIEYQRAPREIQHTSVEVFVSELRLVWKALATRATADAHLVVRFGSINDRDVDHVLLLKESLKDSGWVLRTITEAGDANSGKRQARQFRLADSLPRMEHDFYAVPA